MRSHRHRRRLTLRLCAIDEMILGLTTLGLTCPSFAARATLDWIQNFVEAEQLCPWAREARTGSGFRLKTVKDLEELEAAARQEANLLAASSVPRATTLLVLDDSVTQPSLADFGHTCSAVVHNTASEGIDVLGFHPQRIDTGPGCSNDPEDAAHYSVRSPMPLLQLSRRDDLDSARRDWQATHSSPLPGALELLHGNKRRLREIGPAALRARFDGFVRGREARRGASDVRMSLVDHGGSASYYDVEPALFVCCLAAAAYFSSYASEGYEPHRL